MGGKTGGIRFSLGLLVVLAGGVVAMLFVGSSAASPGLTAYVVNVTDGTVTPITLATNTAGNPIAVGSRPEGVAITPDGTTAYVTNGGDGTVTPITVATNTAGTPITVGSGPVAIAITPAPTSNQTRVTASVESTIEISATPVVDFGPVAVGTTILGTPDPASVRVTTNLGGYSLSVSRTDFTGGDIPLSLAVSPPSGATSNLSGQTPIPDKASLTIGRRADAPPLTGDNWSPVYRLGPVPFRAAGPTSAVITFTAVAT
jgi:YVTN family beta-propeller protein